MWGISSIFWILCRARSIYDTTTTTVHGAVRINQEKIRQDPFHLSCFLVIILTHCFTCKINPERVWSPAWSTIQQFLLKKRNVTTWDGKCATKTPPNHQAHPYKRPKKKRLLPDATLATDWAFFFLRRGCRWWCEIINTSITSINIDRDAFVFRYLPLRIGCFYWHGQFVRIPDCTECWQSQAS